MAVNTTIEETQISDAQLLQRFLDGDSEAFSALVKRYQQNLYAFLSRFLGDAALAEDVFQETFLQVYQSAPMFDMTRTFRPWLFTVAANKARDALRSRKRRSAAPLDAVIGSMQDAKNTYASLIPSEIPSPDEISMNLETQQNVKIIIEQLPENYRLVLILSYFQEIPHKEIAEILDIPVGTVKSRLHGAVGLFAEKWKAFTAEDTGHRK
ncbi:MAG: sigma-70 family RNA polymerase sigma factor [Phycisphaerae bacterium]|nr:sigma-70 family RNA polymerase sigma factor [Phycisphaerae bacterium]